MMACHTAPAAVSDQIVAKRSLMHLSTGQAVHTAIAATAQHWAHTAIIRVCKVSSSGKCLCMGVAQERNENPTCAITWNQRIPASDIIPGIHLNLVRTAPTTNTVNCLEIWLVITCTTRSYEYVGYMLLTSCWLAAVISMCVAYKLWNVFFANNLLHEDERTHELPKCPSQRRW